jgi:hypothetical protein
MQRTYLREDIRLIARYFPGARTVALRTPFDLTDRPVGSARPSLDTLQGDPGRHTAWAGEAV